MKPCYQWTIGFAELQDALGMKNKQEIEKALGLDEPCWETRGREETLTLYERDTLHNWETTPSPNDFALRIYTPIHTETDVLKALVADGMRYESPPIDYNFYAERYEDEEMSNFLMEQANKIHINEEFVKKLCETIRLEIPPGQSASETLATAYDLAKKTGSECPLKKINTHCQTTYGGRMAPSILQFCEYFDDGPDDLLVNNRCLYPLVAINQSIEFTDLGRKILQLGIQPIREIRLDDTDEDDF